MSRITRSLIALTTAAVVLASPATTYAASQFPSAPHQISSAVANDPEGAQAAGDYIVANLDGDHVPDDEGGATADAVLALLAVGGYDAEVEEMTDWLETQAVSYATGGGPAAGKLAIVAAATGRDPSSFGDVDLVAEIEGSLLPDGQCGEFGFAFGQALCILGLDRSEAPVPQEAVDYLLTFQDESGAFGMVEGETFTADLDGSGLALAALSGVADQPGAAASATQVQAFLIGELEDEGYWAGFSPVNSNGVIGPALQLVGEDVTEPTEWVSGQQLDDGGLPNELGGTTPDLLATSQGALLLAGESYLSVGEGGTDTVDLEAVEDGTATDDQATATDEPAATEEETSATEEPTTATEEDVATATEEPTATEEDAATATEEPTETTEQPAATGDELGTEAAGEESETGSGALPWVIGGVVVLGLGGLLVVLQRRRGQQE